jgi:hypothetical protein
VNLLIYEWEDWITDGFNGNRRIPYTHVICYLLAKTVGFPEQETVLRESKSMFPEYKPPGPTDRRRGGRTMRALHDHMTPADIANNEEADLALREAEAHSRLHGLLGAALLGSDSDDEDYTLRDDTAGSNSRAPTAPNMAQAQFELMQSLQSELIHMRKSKEDRFDAVMRKSQKHDEALTSLFVGQQTLLEQMREDTAHNDYQFAYIFNKTSMLPPVPIPPSTQPL